MGEKVRGVREKRKDKREKKVNWGIFNYALSWGLTFEIARLL